MSDSAQNERVLGKPLGVRKRYVFCPTCKETRSIFSEYVVANCRECSSMKARRRTKIVCPTCDSTFEVTSIEIKRNRRFCSDACRLASDDWHRNIDRAAVGAKFRVTRRGSGNPMWKGDAAKEAHKRKRMENERRSGPCERCREKPGCDRHHIDGDTGNNHQSNIRFLCRRCHMIEDGRLDRLVEENRKGRIAGARR